MKRLSTFLLQTTSFFGENGNKRMMLAGRFFLLPKLLLVRSNWMPLVPNLEIVIPSATVVRGAVGPERFDLLTGLSTAQCNDSVISTLDKVFDENYTIGKKRARDTSQSTPAVVVTRTLRFQRNQRSVDVAVSSLSNETVWNVLHQHNPTAVFRNVFAIGPNRQRLIDEGVKYRCFQNPSAGEFADADLFRMSIGQLCELSEQQPYCFKIEYKDMGNVGKVSDED